MHLEEIDFPRIIIIARKVGRMSTAAKIIIEIGVVRKFRAELDLFQINFHPTLRKSRLLLYDSWMTTANRGRWEQRVRKINGIWNTSTKKKCKMRERETVFPMCSRMNNKFGEQPKAILWRSLLDNFNNNAYSHMVESYGTKRERERERKKYLWIY